VSSRSVDSNVTFWCVVAACLVALTFAVSSVSLWIDEGFIAWAVDHRTPLEIARALVPPYIPSPADRQYPLYDLWMWLWTRAFGTSEYALRMANLPFAGLYVVAIALAGRYAFRNRFAWVPFALAPFVWYYVGEARPYIMLMGFAACAASAMAVYAFAPPPWSARGRTYVLPFLAIALASHILAILVIPGLVVIGVLAVRARPDLTFAAWRRPLLIWATPFAALVLFYGLTLGGGRVSAEVSNNQNRGGSVAEFALGGIYEQAGFAGLGPPRNLVRSGGFFEALPPYALPLGLGVAGFALAVGLGLREGSRRVGISVVAWGVSTVLALALSEVLGARFLGRHLAAVFPLASLALLSLMRTRAQVVLFLAVFVASDIRFATLDEYGKDDYRSAVSDVMDRQRYTGGAIDWVADDITANYYGLSLVGGRQDSGAISDNWPVRAYGVFGMNLDAATTRSLLRMQLRSGRPVYVALSKADTFDAQHGWQAAILDLKPRVVATYRTFTIYEFGAGKRRTK
jgi:hypothetical protein